MHFPFAEEKALPEIPVDISAGGNAEEKEWSPVPFPRATPPALPSIQVKKAPSAEEMIRQHQLWNGAGLTARESRRRRRRIPAPIFIPEPGNIPYAVPSVGSYTPPTSQAPKCRCGFLSARLFAETQVTEKKVPSTLEALRSMAQDRLKKKLRYAKSAPNLCDLVETSKRGVRPSLPMNVQVLPRDVEISDTGTLSSPGEPETPETVPQSGDPDENAIYFTLDPSWRVSQGSVKFQPITPLPNSPTFFGRPDSPLLHRQHSLDQLSSAAQEISKTLSAMGLPEYPSDTALHPIDELHACLDL